MWIMHIHGLAMKERVSLAESAIVVFCEQEPLHKRDLKIHYSRSRCINYYSLPTDFSHSSIRLVIVVHFISLLLVQSKARGYWQELQVCF